jgi:hypothetical protein
MPQSYDVQTEVEDRARVRSTALLEPYVTALAHVQSLPLGTSVMAEPSLSQKLLEGRIFGYLRHLFDPERPRGVRRGFEITGIWADPNHLELAARGADLPAALCGLLPAWMPGDRTVGDGIPGLRHTNSEHGDGVSFYLAGQPGRVTFTGVSLKDFEDRRRAALADSGLRGATSDQPLLALEARSRIGHTDDMPAGSAVARRLGLLMHPCVTAIDSWWARTGRFDVELIVPADGPDPMPQILSHMQSPHLAPRLSLRLSDGHHHIMSIEGSSAEIDVRILRRPV